VCGVQCGVCGRVRFNTIEEGALIRHRAVLLSRAHREGAMGDMRDKEAQLRMMREECRDLAVKINTLEMDKTEHELVMAALKPLDPARKCFRMIGNVVVERTVAEVLPAVEKNRDQISGTVKMFTEMMAKKQQAASDFAAEHKIQEQRTSAPAKEAPTSDEGSSQGVLI